ncbi:MAG: YdcF family protein [Oscillospiraceae bacterium]|nr:YdcF family protein [Oscillospiraceae bacterium]
MRRMLRWLIAAALCALAGAAMVPTPMRFTGALLLAAAPALALCGLLWPKKWARRAIILLAAVAFAALGAAEIKVISYGYTDSAAEPDAVIVLGAGVYGTTPSLSLTVQLEAALDYIADKPDVPVIVSGGQGDGEDITEARCMADWLIARGVDAERIWLEEQSASTAQNIAYSKALLAANGIDPNGSIAVVTADYHLYRALLYWDGDGMIPVSASMTARMWYITVNSYIREAFGVLWLLAERCVSTLG